MNAAPLERRRAASSFVGGPFGALLFFMLPAILNAQLSVRGELFREISAKPGTIISLNIGVHNGADAETIISLGQMDFTAGSTAPAGMMPRSLATWITLPGERMSLAAKSPSEIKLRLAVPPETRPGSYWSAVTISSATEAADPAGKGLSVGIRTCVVVVICVTVPGGRREALVGGVEIRAGKLRVPVMGTGDEVFILKITAAEFPDQTIRVFPGTTRELEYDIADLANGPHEIRLLLDDGDKFVVPQKVRFTKVPPPPVPLPVTAEARRSYRTLRGSLVAVLAYGNFQKGVSLQGSASWKALSIQSGTDQIFYRSNIYQTYNVRAGLNFGHVSLSAGRMWFASTMLTSLGASLSVPRLNVALYYTPEYKIVSGSAGFSVFRNVYASVWMSNNIDSGRRDWRASVQIPIF